jgi:hypothetical protein
MCSTLGLDLSLSHKHYTMLEREHKTLSITTFSIMGIVTTLSIDIQHNSFECHYAECHYAECHYAECRHAECRYVECGYACQVQTLY